MMDHVAGPGLDRETETFQGTQKDPLVAYPDESLWVARQVYPGTQATATLLLYDFYIRYKKSLIRLITAKSALLLQEEKKEGVRQESIFGDPFSSSPFPKGEKHEEGKSYRETLLLVLSQMDTYNRQLAIWIRAMTLEEDLPLLIVKKEEVKVKREVPIARPFEMGDLVDVLSQVRDHTESVIRLLARGIETQREMQKADTVDSSIAEGIADTDSTPRGKNARGKDTTEAWSELYKEFEAS